MAELASESCGVGLADPNEPHHVHSLGQYQALWRTVWLPVCYKLCVVAKSPTASCIQLKSPYNVAFTYPPQQDSENKTDGSVFARDSFSAPHTRKGEVY